MTGLREEPLDGRVKQRVVGAGQERQHRPGLRGVDDPGAVGGAQVVERDVRDRGRVAAGPVDHDGQPQRRADRGRGSGERRDRRDGVHAQQDLLRPRRG